MYADAAAMAKRFSGRVAGCGMSWTKAWAKDPKLDFWYTDRAHPSAKGYYINACVIFAALTDCRPIGMAVYAQGLDKTPITNKEALLLQKAAWDQYQEDRKREVEPDRANQSPGSQISISNLWNRRWRKRKCRTSTHQLLCESEPAIPDEPVRQ